MQDIRRIAFVSQRFLELQGLGPALFGASLILGCLMIHLPGTVGSGATFMPFLLGNSVGIMTPYLQRSYRRSFGHAVVTGVQQFTASLPQVLMMTGALADTFFQMEGRFAPSIAAIALAASSSMIVLRDWRWRMHHLVGVGAGVAGTIVTSVIPHVAGPSGGIGPERVDAYLLAYTIVGLGLMATGLLDHRLLASFIRPADQVEAAADLRSRATAARRAVLGAIVSILVGSFAWFTNETVVAFMLAPVLMGLALLIQVLISIPDVGGTVRAISRSERAPELSVADLNVPHDVLVAFFMTGGAAAFDSAIFPHRVPYLFIGALVVMGTWLVTRDWDGRGNYAVVVLAAVLAAVVAPNLEPARAFAFFISAVSGGLATAWIVDAAGLKTRPTLRRV